MNKVGQPAKYSPFPTNDSHICVEKSPIVVIAPVSTSKCLLPTRSLGHLLELGKGVAGVRRVDLCRAQLMDEH